MFRREFYLKILYLTTWVFVATSISTVHATLHDHEWLRTENMDGNGLYILDWIVLQESEEIVFRATVNTRGFIGLGFSYKKGRMSDSDLILAWVDDRTAKPNVLDCHGSPNSNGGIPIQDDTQNVIIDTGYQNATHTQIQFRRSLSTCDPNDVEFSSDTIKILWSYGDSDPIFSEMKGHGTNRGVRSLYLISPMERKTSHNRNARHWDVTVKNISIESNMDTLYWCKIFRAPILQDKHHIIGYEPLLTKDSNTQKSTTSVHHMTLYECSYSNTFGYDLVSWDVWVKSNGAVCNSNLLTPRYWDSCVTPIAAWSIGSTGQFLPRHVGYPMGGKLGSKYYMLEIHYDNPNAKRFIDHSGFRIHYTRQLRKNDGGIMISGVSVSDTQMIPPMQKLYRNIGICGPSCTSSVIPDDGISIVSVAMHTHIAGRKIRLKHIRNGQELQPIVEDENYDYNYQQVRQLQNETNLLPGDYLITECSYETLNRKHPTFGGYSTKQEMCLSFISYYPKTDLVGCYSMTPVKEFFETFGVFEFYSMNMTDVENLFLYNGNILDIMPSTNLENVTDDKIFKNQKESNSNNIIDEDSLHQNSILNKLIISDPVEFHDRSFLAHLNQLPWSEVLFTRRVEESMLFGKHMIFCRLSKESSSIAAEIINYPNFIKHIKATVHCPFHQQNINDLNLSHHQSAATATAFYQSHTIIMITFSVTIMLI